jgi:hypothetical protein
MSVIDTLTLLFTADTADFDKATGKITKGAKKNKQDISELGSAYSKLQTTSKSAVSSLASSLAAPIAGFITLHSVISNVNKAMDRMAGLSKESRLLGMSTTSLQSFQQAFQKVGISPDSVGSTLERLQMHVADEAMSGQAGSISKLGLNASTLSGQSGEQQYNATIAALARVRNEGEKARISVDLFGKEAGLAIAQGLNPQSIADATAKLHKFGLLLSDKDTFSVAAAKRSIDDYALSFEGLWQQLTIRYSPDTQAFFKMVTDDLLDVQQGVRAVGTDGAKALDPLEEVFGGILDLVNDINIGLHGVANVIGAVVGYTAKGLGDIGHWFGGDVNVMQGFGQALLDQVAAADKANAAREKNPPSERWKKLRDKAIEDASKAGPQKQNTALGVEDKTSANLLAKLREEAATLHMTSAEKQLYELTTHHATEAQTKEAKALASWIDAVHTAEKVDPMAKAKDSLREYQNALDQGTISWIKWRSLVQEVGAELSGVHDADLEYQKEIARLEEARLLRNRSGRRVMTEDQYAEGVTAAGRKRDSDRLNNLGIVASAGNTLAKHQQEVSRIADLWKRGKISADEYHNTIVKLGQDLGIGPSISEQITAGFAAQKKLETWAAEHKIAKGSQEYKDKSTELLPDFIKGLKDAVKTPGEKFAEEANRIRQWWASGGISTELANKSLAKDQEEYNQQMGLGQYHRFSGAQFAGSDSARETIMRSQYGATDIQSRMLTVQQKGFGDVVAAIKDNKGTVEAGI